MTTKFPPSPVYRNNALDQSERLNVLSVDTTLRDNLANDTDPVVQFNAACSFSNQAHAVMPPATGLSNAGIVPIIIRSLTNTDARKQMEAISAITKIAAVSSEYATVVVESGTVPVLISLLHSPPAVTEQVVNALGTIASGNPVARDMLLDQNALSPLLGLISHTTAQQSSMLRTATWALSSFCGGLPLPVFEKIVAALPAAARLLNSVDEEVIASSCWVFAYATHEERQTTPPPITHEHITPEEHIAKIQIALDEKIARRVIDLLTHRSMAVQLPAVKAVGNIALGNEPQIQALLDNKVLASLEPLLQSPRVQVRSEACRALSNLAKGSESQKQAVIDSGIVPKVLILTNDSVQVAKEAIIFFSNLVKGSQKQIKYLVSQGCIPPLCDHVLASNSDAGLVYRALEAIELILQAGDRTKNQQDYTNLIKQAGGLERFDLLQFHNNKHIYQKSNELLEKYFNINK